MVRKVQQEFARSCTVVTNVSLSVTTVACSVSVTARCCCYAVAAVKRVDVS